MTHVLKSCALVNYNHTNDIRGESAYSMYVDCFKIIVGTQPQKKSCIKNNKIKVIISVHVFESMIFQN